jgi:hypothetical protein
MRDRLGAVTVICLLVASSSACSGSSGGASGPDVRAADPASTTSTSSSTTIPAVPSSFDELAARLISDVPAGFVVQPDAVGDTGPSDLAKAIRDDDDPATAGPRLRGERFVRGYQRLWIGSRQAEIIVFVYQFAAVRGAAEDFAYDKAQLASQSDGARTFATTGFPAGTAAAVAGTEGDKAAAIVLFTTGVFNVQIVSTGSAAAVLRAGALALAIAQSRSLRAAR